MSFLWLREEISVADGDAGALVVRSPRRQVTFGRLGPGIRDALRRLGGPGEDEDRLVEFVAQTDGPDALATWFYYLDRLNRLGYLRRSAQADGVRLATLVSLGPGFVPTREGLAPHRPRVLSRFAYLRREGGEAVLESPRARARIVLHDSRAAALVGALAWPRTADDLGAAVPGLSAGGAGQVVHLLVAAGMLEEVGDNGTPAEDENPALQSWEFHDLLFHARTRAGRHDAPIGGTYRFAGRLPPPPAWKTPETTDAIELHRPDLERLQREDPPLARVQEGRRSLREYAATPLSGHQLGEFLYRVARVKEAREADVGTPEAPLTMQFTSRPYPAGGALYELEFYAAVNACADLAPGLYHYDPLHHRLGRLAGRTPEVEQLLAEAGRSAGISPDTLQVLLILAARFPRLAWKYESIAYALILKDVGVVYQSMYLAATAMNFSPCALGCGDADLFARAAGTDYYAETSVGEFLLGSKP